MPLSNISLGKIALVALLAAGVITASKATHSSPLNEMAISVLNDRDGILVLLDPMDCRLKAGEVDALDSVLSLGHNIHVVFLRSGVDSSYGEFVNSLAMAVPMEVDSTEVWLNAIKSLGLRAPVSLILRVNRIEAILAGPKAYDLLPILRHQ